TPRAARDWRCLLSKDHRQSSLSHQARFGDQEGDSSGYLREDQGDDRRPSGDGEEVNPASGFHGTASAVPFLLVVVLYFRSILRTISTDNRGDGKRAASAR